MSANDKIAEIPQDSDGAGEGAGSTAAKIKAIAAKAARSARVARHKVLADLHADGQLTLWRDEERGIPNELVRCALFPAKNRKEKREMYKASAPLTVPIIGGGQVLYFGEELRQDDETVWMQLVHLSKEARSEWVSFSPYSFIQNVGWPVKKDSYARLLASIRRLSGGGLEVYSQRFDRGMKTQLIRTYEYSQGEATPWRVKVFDREDGLLFLFDKLYSRLDWATRLSLPDGIATWLHSFFASHKEAYDHKIETLAKGAGLKLHDPEDDALGEAERMAKLKERLREAKKAIVRGLQALKDSGFLVDFEVTRKNLVKVRRVGDTRPIT